MSPRLLQNAGEGCVAGADDSGWESQRSCPFFFLTAHFGINGSPSFVEPCFCVSVALCDSALNLMASAQTHLLV